MEATNTNNFPSIERTLPSTYQEVEEEIQDLLKNDDIPQHGLLFYLVYNDDKKNRSCLSKILQKCFSKILILWTFLLQEE